MNSKRYSMFKIFSLLVFVIGVYAFASRYYSQDAKVATLDRKPVFLVLQEYSVENKKAGPVTRLKTIAVNPQESYKITNFDLASGQSNTTVGNQLASFVVKNDSLQYQSPADYFNDFNRNSMSEDFFRSNKLFAGESVVCGLKTFILRNDDGETTFEDYYSPQIGWFAVKRVKTDKASGDQEIEEAVSIQFRDLANHEYQIPKLPIKFDDANQMIASLRASGHPNNLRQADFMISKLEEVKNKLGIK